MLEILAADADERLDVRALILKVAGRFGVSTAALKTYITDLEARRLLKIVGTGKFADRKLKITKAGLDYLTGGKVKPDGHDEGE
jgi:hypothetical protein